MARKAEIIPPSGDLRRRAVNQSKGLDLRLKPEDLKKLEEVVHRSRDKFITDIAVRLKNLRQAGSQASQSRDAHRAYVRLLGDESLHIKGAGGTIGFELLTLMGKSLNDLVKGKQELSDMQVDIVGLHIDALYVVLAQRITGAGGVVEEQVLRGLRDAVSRFA